MADVFSSILSDLRQLEARGSVGIFGENAHGYQINSPLSPAAISEFEIQHRFNIPDEYREFLLRVGNGGAGPNYGLFPLGMNMQLRDIAPWDESVGDPALPFPHTSAWNDLSGQPTEADEEDLNLYDLLTQRFEERYFDPKWVNGTLPLSDRGCALGVLLVINGPETGNVWYDDRSDYSGIYPLQQRASPRVGFLQWYRDWLDEALAKL